MRCCFQREKRYKGQDTVNIPDNKDASDDAHEDASDDEDANEDATANASASAKAKAKASLLNMPKVDRGQPSTQSISAPGSISDYQAALLFFKVSSCPIMCLACIPCTYHALPLQEAGIKDPEQISMFLRYTGNKVSTCMA